MRTASRSARLRWIHPPQQERSRDKMGRMLEATEALLDQKNFDELTIAQIAKKARVSVGLFYTRFDNKDALLSALYEKHVLELRATTSRMFDPKRWSTVSVTRFIEELVAFMVRFHRKKRGLLRALVLRHHSRPGRRYEDPAERAKTAIAAVGRFLATRSDEIPHPDPRLAGSLGFLFVLGALREKILFSEGVARALRISDKRLAKELTTAFLGYLGLPKQLPEMRRCS